MVSEAAYIGSIFYPYELVHYYIDPKGSEAAYIRSIFHPYELVGYCNGPKCSERAYIGRIFDPYELVRHYIGPKGSEAASRVAEVETGRAADRSGVNARPVNQRLTSGTSNFTF